MLRKYFSGEKVIKILQNFKTYMEFSFYDPVWTSETTKSYVFNLTSIYRLTSQVIAVNPKNFPSRIYIL